MKLFLVEVEIFDLWDYDIVFDTSYSHNVYSSFEHAKKEGMQDLKKRIKKIEEMSSITFTEMLKEEKLDYVFEITRDRWFSICRKFWCWLW